MSMNKKPTLHVETNTSCMDLEEHPDGTADVYVQTFEETSHTPFTSHGDAREYYFAMLPLVQSGALQAAA